MAGGAGDEGLGGVWKDGDIGGTGTSREGGPEFKRRPGVLAGCRLGSFGRVLLWDGGGGIGSGVIDRYAARAAVGDDDGPHVGRDPSEAGVFSGTNGGDLPAAFEVDHADGVGGRVGDVGAAPGLVDADEVGLTVDSDGGHNRVEIGVDDGDGSGSCVYRIDFISFGICGDSGGVVAYSQSAVRTQVDEIENADCIGVAVGDVGELAIAGWDVGKATATAAKGQQENKREQCEWTGSQGMAGF